MAVLLVGLAAWRVASILSREKIATPFRKLFGIIEYPDGSISIPDTFVAKLLSCIYCLTVWTAALFYIIYQFSPEVVEVFAAASLAVAFENKVWQ